MNISHPIDWMPIKLSKLAKVNPEQLTGKKLRVDSFYYLDLASVNEGKIVLPDSEVEFINAPSRARRIVRDGDVLMSTVRPNLLGHAIFQASEKSNPTVCSTGFAVLRPIHKEDKDYIYQYLTSNHITHQINGLTAGSSYPAINPSDVSSLKVYAPISVAEREKIGNSLSKWDSAIRITERLIAAKSQLRKFLMQKLLTGKLRFREFSTPWETVKIGDLFKIIRRPVVWDNVTEYRLVSIRRRSGGLFLRKIVKESEIKTKDLCKIKTDDFLISRRQVVHGACSIVKKEFNGMCVSNSYLTLRVRDPELLDVSYFDWLSKTPEMYHVFYKSSHGVHIEKLFFAEKYYLKQTIKIPRSIKEQKKIVLLLNTVNQMMMHLESQRDLLREQKRGLMQQLLTGKIRVNVRES